MAKNLFSTFTSEEIRKAFSDKLVRNVLEEMPAAIALLQDGEKTPDGKPFYTCTYANKAADTISGEHLEGRHFVENDGYIYEKLQGVSESTEPATFVHNWISGPEKWLHFTANHLKNGVLLTFLDKTWISNSLNKSSDSDGSAEKIELNENFIQRMASATPDIMFVISIPSKEIIFSTRNIAHELGYGHQEILKMDNPFTELIHPEDLPRMLAHVDGMKTAEDGEVREIEYRMIAADGKMRWFEDRNTIFKRNRNGVPIQKMGISHDITDRKAADLQIKLLNESLSDKNRELETANNELKTFTSIASYDYQDILKTLYTNLEFIILKDGTNLSNTGKGNLRKAQTAIQKMKLLTDDIVALSKIQLPESNPSRVDLNDILKSVVNELADRITEAQATVVIGTLPTINGYSFLLKLYFYHLLDNAVKFHTTIKTPTINISNTVQTMDSGALQNHISITDNGIGFPQDEAEKIFRMFYKLHDKEYKGSGIGLTICRKIARIHKGEITANGVDGKGAVFNTYFDLVD